MKLFYALFVSVILANNLFGQNNPIVEYNWPAFKETPPIYPGCNEKVKNNGLKKCFQKQISFLINKNFDTLIINSIELPKGLIRIDTHFKIDTLGNVIDIKAQAPHPKLQQETIRVLKLIPKMEESAIRKGKKVSTIYRLPFFFKN